MKLIKDLGMQEYGTQGKKSRFGIYECECCHVEIRANTADVKRRNMKECKPCVNRKRALKHGFSYEPLYHVWNAIKYRCKNSNHKAYNDYGGRGITVCEEWLSYEVFREWSLNNGYMTSLTIDRVDNDGNYCPNNCRWTTAKVQANNKRKPKKRI